MENWIKDQITHLNVEVRSAYLTGMIPLIRYYRDFFKAKKITKEKPFKTDYEKVYPLTMKNQELLVIEGSSSGSWLIKHQEIENKMYFSVHQFWPKYNEKEMAKLKFYDSLINCYSDDHPDNNYVVRPSLEYLLSGKEGEELANYHTTSDGKVMETGLMTRVSLEKDNAFFEKMLILLIEIEDKYPKYKAFNEQPLVEAISPFIKKIEEAREEKRKAFDEKFKNVDWKELGNEIKSKLEGMQTKPKKKG